VQNARRKDRQLSTMSIGRRALIIDILHMTILLGLLFVILFIFFHNGLSSGSSYLYDGTEFAPVVDYLLPSRLIDETEADYRARQNNPEFLSTTDLSHRIVVFYSPWCPVSLNVSCPSFINFTYNRSIRDVLALSTLCSNIRSSCA
jgi:hypothetical protein